jgi:chloramphenicol 3-O phosphotransferase
MAANPRVVILNGASCAGKTTIATSFRDQRAATGDFWFLTGIDDILEKLPSEWRSVGLESGPFAADGLRFETTAEGLEVRVGRVGRQLLRAYKAGVAEAVRAGLNVIVAEVIIDPASWHDWTAALAGLEVIWVGVQCSPDVVTERERMRPSRYAGLARAQTTIVHRAASYDFEIDTTSSTVSEALSELTNMLGY